MLLCEQDADLVAQLQKTKAKLAAEAVRIERGNGVTALERAVPQSLHLVLLDPPFETPALYEPALRAAARALRPEGAVYLEAARRWNDDELAAFGLRLKKRRQARAKPVHTSRMAARVLRAATTWPGRPKSSPVCR